MRQLLDAIDGPAIPVRGVVVYPGWWIEQTNKERPHEVWVLEPKALPGWIENAPAGSCARGRRDGRVPPLALRSRRKPIMSSERPRLAGEADF